MKKTVIGVFILLFGFLSSNAQMTTDTTVLNIAEQMPEYPGGVDSLIIEISSRVVYPKECLDSNIEGKVYLRFVVNEDGSVSDIIAVKGPHKLLKDAAITAAQSTGKFKPGMHKGKVVKVYSYVPVIFKMEVDAVAEVSSQFPGGNGKLFSWIENHMLYPQKEWQDGIQGKVIVRFIVNEDGSTSGGEVIRSVSPGLDAEALRLVSKLPKFKPATQGGVPVKVYFTLPVGFYVKRTPTSGPAFVPHDYRIEGGVMIYKKVPFGTAPPEKGLSGSQQ